MATGFTKDASSIYPWIEKAANEDLNYAFNWAKTGDDWLGANTIQSSTWTMSPSGASPGLQKYGEAINVGLTIIKLKEGVAGRKYILTNKVTTSDGRIGERSFEVRVVKR